MASGLYSRFKGGLNSPISVDHSKSLEFNINTHNTS